MLLAMWSRVVAVVAALALKLLLWKLDRFALNRIRFEIRRADRGGA